MAATHLEGSRGSSLSPWAPGSCQAPLCFPCSVGWEHGAWHWRLHCAQLGPHSGPPPEEVGRHPAPWPPCRCVLSTWWAPESPHWPSPFPKCLCSPHPALPQWGRPTLAWARGGGSGFLLPPPTPSALWPPAFTRRAKWPQAALAQHTQVLAPIGGGGSGGKVQEPRFQKSLHIWDP